MPPHRKKGLSPIESRLTLHMETGNYMDSESVDPGELPLVVWLKGDESFFDHFSLDADQVMKQLGIKRSRLRQISGQELRVGRKRVDRYIRPVYRPEDVDRYLNWTRATASHKKSSGLLQQAVSDLNGLSGQIQETFSGDILAILARVEESLLRLSKYSEILTREVREELSSDLSLGLTALREDLFNFRETTEEILGGIDRLSTDLGKLSLSLEVFQGNLMESNQNSKASLQTSLDSREDLQKVLNGLLQVENRQATHATILESLTRPRRPKLVGCTGQLAARQLQRRKHRPGSLNSDTSGPRRPRPRYRLTTRFT